MNNKSPLFTCLIVVLIGTLVLAFESQKVEANNTTYIRADGRVEGTTYIKSDDNVTYVFTADISDSIIVERNSTVIDGNGFRLQGSGSGIGFTLLNTFNVTIKNVNIKGFSDGVWLESTSSNIISNNSMTDNTEFGIVFQWFCYDNSVCGNNITGSFCGVFVHDSADNTICCNNIKSNSKGLYFEYGARNNSVCGNNIEANIQSGIVLSHTSFNNNINRNNISLNPRGIQVQFYSRNNTIAANTIRDNERGIDLTEASNENSIYHNNFVNNTAHIYIDNSASIWDNGIEGNYWSNYCNTDLDCDGLGDEPYTINEDNTDNYPLMGMFSSLGTSLDCRVNVISNSTIESFEYFESNSTVRMHVSNMTANQTFGFVRVCIPHDLMNGTHQVMIDGAEPYYVNYTLYDNGTHRWIYLSYEHSTLEIVIVQELQSFLIQSLFMTATMLVVIIYRRKHLK